MAQVVDSKDRPLVPALADCERQFEEIEQRATDLCEGLSDEQLLYRPRGGKGWSIAECLGHLNAVGFLYTPVFDRALADARSRNLLGDGPFKLSLKARLACRMLEPPYRMRTKTFAPMQPQTDLSPQQVLGEFIELQGELIKRLHEANGVDLKKVVVASPFSRFIRFDFLGWASFHAAHERRHLWQGEQVREDPDFPRG